MTRIKTASLIAIVFLAARISTVAQPVAASAPQGKSLLEYRAGFTTKLIRREMADEPVPEPPPKVFRLVKYPSPAGELAAYVTPPPVDNKKRPAIIWIFGGFGNGIDATAWEKASPENDQSARAFREAGVITMYPSLRGGNKNPGVIEGFYGEVDDVLAAREYLAKLSYVDTNRIYLGGHSTGGTLVLLAAECTDQFRAIFSFGPVSDPARYGADLLPYNTQSVREASLRAPVKWLSFIRNPTFVFEGADGNASELRVIARASKNPLLHTQIIEGASHFSTLAPMTKLVAAKILQDTGKMVNLSFSEADVARAFKR